MSKQKKYGKLGCGFWCAFLLLFIIMVSSGVSPRNFFIGVGIGVVIIAVVCAVAEKRKKK